MLARGSYQQRVGSSCEGETKASRGNAIVGGKLGDLPPLAIVRLKNVCLPTTLCHKAQELSRWHVTPHLAAAGELRGCRQRQNTGFPPRLK